MQTTTYEYSSTNASGNPSGLNFHINRTGSEPQQNATYEYSRSVGHPGAPLEHAHSASNITKTYEYSSNVPNFGGSSNVGTYEISRTIGHPSQISTTTYEISGNPRSHERHSAHTATSSYLTPYDTNPVVTKPYGQERVVKSSRPAQVERDDDEHSHSSEHSAERIDFNHDELVDLMAEEHRHIRGNEPIITKDIPISTYKTTYDDHSLKYSTADLLKNYPSSTVTTTTYQVEREKKSHAPIDTIHVDPVPVHVDPLPVHVHVPVDTHHHTTTHHTTTHHGIEEWSKKKYLHSLADQEEEVEETRLDYCGLCVSKRRGRKPKY